jgi:hypothetical protein
MKYMDLRQFYRKIRGVEASIPEPYPLVTSLGTADGGKEGLVAEVPRFNAARMIVEGKARLATDDEKKSHLEELASAQQAFAEWEAFRRRQFDLPFAPESKTHLSKPKASNK